MATLVIDGRMFRRGGEPGPGLWVTRATYWFSSDIFSKPLFLLLFPGLDPPFIRGLAG